jgi:hypothetical protein
MRRFQLWLYRAMLVLIFLFPSIVHSQSGAQQIAARSINGIIFVDGVKYRFTFAGFLQAISDCTTARTCPGVDARALTGLLNTASTTIVLSKRMFVLLGDVNIASTANPIIDIRANGIQIIGTGGFFSGNIVGTTLQDNSNNATTITLRINQPGVISGVAVKNVNLMVTQGQKSGDGISLSNAQRNTFEDIFIGGHTTLGTDAIKLAGADYFNEFRRISIGQANQSFEISGTASSPSNFNWLENSTVGNAGPGVAIRLDTFASHNILRNIDVEGFTGELGGTQVLGDFNILDSLHIEGGWKSRPIYINGTSTVVRDTVIDSSLNYGIVVDSMAVDTVIDACKFTGNRTGSIQVVKGAQRTRIINGFSKDSTFLTDAGTNTKIWPQAAELLEY